MAVSDVTNRKRKLGELLAEAGPELPWQERDHAAPHSAFD